MSIYGLRLSICFVKIPTINKVTGYFQFIVLLSACQPVLNWTMKESWGYRFARALNLTDTVQVSRGSMVHSIYNLTKVVHILVQGSIPKHKPNLFSISQYSL